MLQAGELTHDYTAPLSPVQTRPALLGALPLYLNPPQGAQRLITCVITYLPLFPAFDIQYVLSK